MEVTANHMMRVRAHHDIMDESRVWEKNTTAKHRITHYLPKYSVDDETIGDEFAYGRIVGLSLSCKRSGHELRRHIRRIP